MSVFRNQDEYNAFIEYCNSQLNSQLWYSDETPYYVPIPVQNNEAATPAQDVWGGNVRPATNDVSTVPASYGSTHANQMISRGSADHSSQMKRSKSSARQPTRSPGGNEGSSHYMAGGAQVQHVGYTQNFSKGHSQLPPQAAVHGSFQHQKPVGYPAEHQRFRENTSGFYSQTAQFQATTAIAPSHGSNQRSGEMHSQWRQKDPYGGPPAIQAPGYQQPSPMQNHLASMRMRDPAPSTLTTSSGASGSTGGTFSSVSARDQGGFRRVPDASQLSNLPHQLSQLQITDNNAGGFGGNMQPSRSIYDVYGGMGAPPATPQQDQYSHYHTCIHTYCHACHPQAHHPSYGDHAAVGAVRIGYCPIHGCNRGPGSNRPFPRTCNLLEHLRGVHKEDIPRGAKLRSWLVSQGYDPDKLVEYAKRS